MIYPNLFFFREGDYIEHSFIQQFKENFIKKLYTTKNKGGMPRILTTYPTLDEKEKEKELVKAMIVSYFSFQHKADFTIYFPEYNIFIEISSLTHHLRTDKEIKNLRKLRGLKRSRNLLGNLVEGMHGNKFTHINLLLKPKEWKRKGGKYLQNIVDCQNCTSQIVEQENVDWKGWFEEVLKPHKKLDCSVESLKIERMLIGMHHFYMISNDSKPFSNSITTDQYTDNKADNKLKFSEKLKNCYGDCKLKLGSDGEINKHSMDDKCAKMIGDHIVDFHGSCDSTKISSIEEGFRERDRKYYAHQLDR